MWHTDRHADKAPTHMKINTFKTRHKIHGHSKNTTKKGGPAVSGVTEPIWQHASSKRDGWRLSWKKKSGARTITKGE